MASLFADLSPEQIDTAIKLCASAVGLAVAILGVPVALAQFRKTQVEIRKLNLEADKLQQAASIRTQKIDSDGLHVSVEGRANTIVITRDPRMVGSLLVMVDFIIASIIIFVFGHAIGMLDGIGDALTSVFAIILYWPVFRTAKQVQKFLRSEVAVSDTAGNSDTMTT